MGPACSKRVGLRRPGFLVPATSTARMLAEVGASIEANADMDGKGYGVGDLRRGLEAHLIGHLSVDRNAVPQAEAHLAAVHEERGPGREASGFSKPATILSVVVLPHPLGPSSEKNSP